MSFSIEIEHQNKGVVTKRLDRWNHIFGSNLIIDTIEKQMDITYQAVYKMAPVKTGYLRDSIYTKTGKDSVEIGVTAYYAYYVSSGAQGRTKNPFWTSNIASLSIETIIMVRNLFAQTF